MGARSPSSSRSAALRVGVVGCGAVAERYHLPALLASADVEPVAFVDAVPERARSLMAGVPGSRVFPAHRDLPGHVDLALVAVPNALHERIAVDLLQAGVHVLVEKPMARTAAECDRMIAAAASSRAVLAIGHDFRHFPAARFARELLAARPFGAVRRVDVRQSVGNRWPSVSADVLSPVSGGGVLMTFGVHLLDLLGWWLGDLRIIACHDDAAGGIEAEAVCEMEVQGGVPVHLEISRLRGMRDTFLIECETATLEIGLYEPETVRLSLRSGAVVEGRPADPEFQQAPLRTVFLRQLADVAAAIREDRAPLVGGADGRRAVAAVEACYALRMPLRRPWDFPEAYLATAREPGR